MTKIFDKMKSIRPLRIAIYSQIIIVLGVMGYIGYTDAVAFFLLSGIVIALIAGRTYCGWLCPLGEMIEFKVIGT